MENEEQEVFWRFWRERVYRRREWRYTEFGRLDDRERES
jgi:hypothetical protein